MRINEITQPNTQGVVKRANATEVEIEDPNKPGVTTKVDLRKANVTQDEKGNTVVTPNAQKPQGPNKLNPGTNITISSNET